MKNYYKILSVNSNATNADILARYNYLSLMFDPAVNMRKGAKGKFKEVSEAYEILTHKPSRKSYDIALKIFENYNQPKERIVVYGDIPYAKGVAGTKEETDSMQYANQFETVPVIKIYFLFLRVVIGLFILALIMH